MYEFSTMRQYHEYAACTKFGPCLKGQGHTAMKGRLHIKNEFYLAQESA